MGQITVVVPDAIQEQIDENEMYNNRSDFVRAALREKISREAGA
jgi:Arc/MetJ-type ribon-helix-helix transcriptional regulator